MLTARKSCTNGASAPGLVVNVVIRTAGASATSFSGCSELHAPTPVSLVDLVDPYLPFYVRK